MLSLCWENVDLESGILKGGNKTAAGKNKVIPIHSKIYSIVKNRYDCTSDYLFGLNNNKTTDIYYPKIGRHSWDASEKIIRLMNAGTHYVLSLAVSRLT